MARTKKVVVAVLVLVACVGGWIAYSFVYALQHIPKAYAAWDTGTLMIDYLEHHQNKWQTSWDELISVMETDRGRAIPLRGSQIGDAQYAQSLRDLVDIDWTFDPARADNRSPITRKGGGPFLMTWEGAEPNEMIRAYLSRQPPSG